jgi:excisionase family DNA binding protein
VNAFEKEVFNPEEAAQWLRVSPQTVYRLLRSGKLPGKKIGQQWRIHKEDLVDYLRGKKN